MSFRFWSPKIDLHRQVRQGTISTIAIISPGLDTTTRQNGSKGCARGGDFPYTSLDLLRIFLVKGPKNIPNRKNPMISHASTSWRRPVASLGRPNIKCEHMTDDHDIVCRYVLYIYIHICIFLGGWFPLLTIIIHGSSSGRCETLKSLATLQFLKRLLFLQNLGRNWHGWGSKLRRS